MYLTTELLDTLSEQAKSSARYRMNYNLHDSTSETVQRLLKAMEPETIVPIHRHLDAAETIILLRGKLEVSYYDENKNRIKSFLLGKNSDSFGVHIPKGVWHDVNVLESGTVIFEVKEGPYHPLHISDILQ